MLYIYIYIYIFVVLFVVIIFVYVNYIRNCFSEREIFFTGYNGYYLLSCVLEYVAEFNNFVCYCSR